MWAFQTGFHVGKGRLVERALPFILKLHTKGPRTRPLKAVEEDAKMSSSWYFFSALGNVGGAVRRRRASPFRAQHSPFFPGIPML